MNADRGLPKFTDPLAGQEVYGFATQHFERMRLPGATWEEGNMFYGLTLPNCDMSSATFHDPVWQFGYPDRLHVYERPEERVLADIFYSDAVRRLQAVEQLTLPPEYTTVPNTGALSRFEHIWGSVLFVRQMAAAHGIEGRDAVRLQLRTLLSDIAHTFGSHLGDWIFQGIGGAENQHDLELASYLEATGINSTLRAHGFDPAEVTFPAISDWVEAPQPDLCVDRVDYGLREMNRWNDVIRSSSFTADDFVLTPERMLAIKDQQRARLFAEGYLLLSQEHWSEPTHRFMLDMLLLRTKLFYGEGGAPRSWVFDEKGLLDLHQVHPRDLMYVTDPAQLEAYALPNLSGHILEAIMKSVARYRRQYVWPGRRERIGQYMRQFCDAAAYDEVMRKGGHVPLESPIFNSYLDEYPKTLPGGFVILDAAVAEATKNELSVDIPQPPLKTRQVDPLVQTATGFVRLSTLDPSFALRLTEHAEILKKPKVARLMIADPHVLQAVRLMFANVEAHWQRRLQASRRLSAQELNNLVSVSASEVLGGYPFMSFIDY